MNPGWHQSAAAPLFPAMRGVEDEGRERVALVRAAAQRHNLTWEALVPNPQTFNLAAEPAEEQAYAEMAAAKHHLRDHICETYGISIAELASLALP